MKHVGINVRFCMFSIGFGSFKTDDDKIVMLGSLLDSSVSEIRGLCETRPYTFVVCGEE